MVKYFRRFDSLIGQGLKFFFKIFFLQKDVLKAVAFFCGYGGRIQSTSQLHKPVKMVRGMKHLVICILTGFLHIHARCSL